MQKNRTNNTMGIKNKKEQLNKKIIITKENLPTGKNK